METYELDGAPRNPIDPIVTSGGFFRQILVRIRILKCSPNHWNPNTWDLLWIPSWELTYPSPRIPLDQWGACT